MKNLSIRSANRKVVSQEAFYEDDAEVPTYFQSPQERRAAQLRELLHPGERDLTGGKSGGQKALPNMHFEKKTA